MINIPMNLFFFSFHSFYQVISDFRVPLRYHFILIADRISNKVKMISEHLSGNLDAPLIKWASNPMISIIVPDQRSNFPPNAAPSSTPTRREMALVADTSAESKKTVGKCNITHRFGGPRRARKKTFLFRVPWAWAVCGRDETAYLRV